MRWGETTKDGGLDEDCGNSNGEKGKGVWERGNGCSIIQKFRVFSEILEGFFSKFHCTDFEKRQKKQKFWCVIVPESHCFREVYN